MTDGNPAATLEREPGADPGRAARGQARRAATVWVFAGTGDPLGALSATALDGSVLLALAAEAPVAPGNTVTLAIADGAAAATAYRSLQTVQLAPGDALPLLQRFKNRHPEVAAGLDAGNLRLWHASPLRVRLITTDAGSIDVAAADYLLDPGSDPEVTENEQANLEHQNKDHLDINLQLVTQILGEPDGHWQLTGLDPEGMDFACGDRRCRLPFPAPAFDRKALGAAIKTYLKAARARLGIEWDF